MDPAERRLSRAADRRAHRFTPATTGRILAAVRAGNSLQVAAEYAGVHRATVHRWLARADDPDATDELLAFRDAYEQARAYAEVLLVSAVMRAALGGDVVRRRTRTHPDGTTDVDEHLAAADGRVGLAFLARRYPQRWAQRAPTSTPPAGPLVDEHHLQALAERVHAALADAEPDTTEP